MSLDNNQEITSLFQNHLLIAFQKVPGYHNIPVNQTCSDTFVRIETLLNGFYYVDGPLLIQVFSAHQPGGRRCRTY